ncbi:hypothetical protein SELMODRAFT_443337 [Selaginella moellendorffii]|uniref:Uncharacterized protein n=1 Tax=Selaginella moellendorffii TaxID=88036 RepID=D8S0J5_SELML|nr:alkaline ceramidase [Selaginella moellendorffii]XP_002980696.1 alkaline ceramidase [Selaginella moellendorffii]EFJ18347.1 hypothetical protein SELMODRAFT_153928 [Selaginella moellendorffii]EFJ22064.1 hypothetical protein SELMODRAFT_443337 [Selaginella moellendorffii]|eukprot:XP_002976954.1 alkaline ceramidase [Selaginella moellendorffii]
MAANGYWGAITSSTEWCERNYERSRYIAEFFNTLSNVPCILLAFIGLYNSISQRFEKRFSVLHLATIALCIGSMLFHATLQHAQQQSDETPMVWVMLLYIYVLYSPDWHYRSTMPTFLFIYGTVFAILHSQFRFVLGFELHYLFLTLLCLPRMYKYYIHSKGTPARRLARWCIITTLVAAFCWVIDRNFCGKVSALPVNPQGHALWHVLMGFTSYFANMFLQFCRAQQLDWSPELRYFFGLLPYIKVIKPSIDEKEE